MAEITLEYLEKKISNAEEVLNIHSEGGGSADTNANNIASASAKLQAYVVMWSALKGKE